MSSSKHRVKTAQQPGAGSKRKATISNEPTSSSAEPTQDASTVAVADPITTISPNELDIANENASAVTTNAPERPRKRLRRIAGDPHRGGRYNEDDTPEATTAHDSELVVVSVDAASKAPSTKKHDTLAKEIEVDITAPEPPSKKALRQLKKGKPLPPPKSGAESTPEPEPKKPETEKRSEHCVWIGNLAWTVSKADLQKFFVDYSDITDEMITRVHMPGPDDKKSANMVEKKRVGKAVQNKGFAYVDFSTADGAAMAIELSEQLLSGRRVLIKDGKSFEGRPEKTKEENHNDGKPPSKRVFLGNLSFDTTEEIVKEHFQKCGPIESVKVATFEDSGKCKGYAWAVFEELEAAQAAVRGFVRIEEESSDASESDGEDGEGVEVKTKRSKMRKWWVNKMKGRPLKIEFAEDAQVRYKKRYGKDGTKKTNTEGFAPGIKEKTEPAKIVPAKVHYRQPYAARLIGGIVESTGKKITF
jgi:RNA recognition motif-containing protein